MPTRAGPTPTSRPMRYATRRVALEDAVDAHLLAAAAADRIGFGRYIVSATTPFLPQDLARLRTDAAGVFARRVPRVAEVWTRRGWRFPAHRPCLRQHPAPVPIWAGVPDTTWRRSPKWWTPRARSRPRWPVWSDPRNTSTAPTTGNVRPVTAQPNAARIASLGAGIPVNCSTWAKAWFSSICNPLIASPPAASTAAASGVGHGS